MANFFSKILNNLFQSDRVVDDDFYEELEEAMIQSDVSYPSAMRIIDAVKREATKKNVNLTKDVQKILRDYLSDLLSVDEDYYILLDGYKGVYFSNIESIEEIK